MFGPWKKDEVTKPEEEDDLVVKLMKQTGCMDLHYAVQSCIAEHKDWRLCKAELEKFRHCMDNYNSRRKENLK